VKQGKRSCLKGDIAVNKRFYVKGPLTRICVFDSEHFIPKDSVGCFPNTSFKCILKNGFFTGINIKVRNITSHPQWKQYYSTYAWLYVKAMSAP